MKQRLIQRTLFFVLAMLAGTGNLWADDTVMSFSSGSFTGATAVYAGTGTLDGGNKFKFGNSDASASTNYVELTLSTGTFKTGDKISLTYYGGNASKVVKPGLFFGSKSGSTFTAAYTVQAPETSAVSSAPTTDNTLTVTADGDGSNVLRLSRYSGGTSLFITNITITRAGSGGGGGGSEPTGTIFSMTDVTGPAESLATGVTADVVATFVGGSAQVYNAKSSAAVMANAKITLGGSGASYFHAKLDVALQAGDVITLDGVNTDKDNQKFFISKTTSKPSSSSEFPYTIGSSSNLVGATDIYLFKDGGNAFTSFTVTRDGSGGGGGGDTPATFDPDKLYEVKTYDFANWGATTLAITSTAAGNIFNKGNNKNNAVFRCTNEGLESLAVQAVISSKKGWTIDATGLLEGSGAGRCAAICDIKKGWFVEFYHTSGNNFYTRNNQDGDTDKDDGIKKKTMVEESGHIVFLAEADGMIGFELDKGKYITKVVIYSADAADAASKAEKYKVAKDFTPASGEVVADATSSVLLQYGVDTWSKSVADTNLKDFEAMTTGTNNPTDALDATYTPAGKNLPTKGAYVVMNPAKNGMLTVGVKVAKDKALFVTDGAGNCLNDQLTITDKDGNSLTLDANNKLSTSADTYANVKLAVAMSTSYYVFVGGSKMGFSGFSYYPTAPYTVKITDDGGTTLLADKNYTDGPVGEKITAPEADLKEFWIGSTKYVLTKSDTIMIVDEPIVTKNIITAKFHVAQPYTYDVVAACDKKEINLAHATVLEGEVVVPYPQYLLVDGTSYKADINKTSKAYQYPFILKKDNQKETIKYTKDKDKVEIINEVEDWTGASTFANANCSGGKAGYSTDNFVQITNQVLTPGKYKLVTNLCETNAKASNEWFVFNAVPRGSVLPTEEATRVSATKTGINNIETDIEIHTPAYIYMKGGNNKVGVDNILIARTGDLDAAKGYVNIVDSIMKDSIDVLTEPFIIKAAEYDVYVAPSKLAVVNDTTYLNMNNGTITVQATTGKAIKKAEFINVVDSCWNYITADLGTIDGKSWTMTEGFDKVIFTFTSDVYIEGISVGGAKKPEKPKPVVGEKGTATYAMAEGETHKSGESVDVKDDKGTAVGMLTFGEVGGADFKAAKKDGAVEGFTAFTEGNGENGNKTGGTFYTFTPKHDGTATVAVVLNADKAFYVEEDGTALADYNGKKETAKYSGTYSFKVKGGSAYKVYCSGSKLGFYGLKYDYEAAAVSAGTEVVAKVIYNGKEESDPEGYFTHDADGKFSFNNKFNGASYDGIDFTNGLKMEGSTKIMFTTPAEATITIVQSTWSDKTLKFDGTELAVADAEAGTGCRIYTIKNVAAGEHNVTRGSGESGIFMIKATYMEAAPVVGGGSADFDFQELCMKLGKGGPWAVIDGGDAGFTVNDAEMHYLGDYTEQEFAWNNRLAYEYVADRGKFTFRNKNNKKDSNCGMFSWDYAHYVSILNLGDGDKVTITIPTGTVKFASDNVEGVAAGDAVESGKTYTIKATDGVAHLDIQMDKATLISRITIEALGIETVPTIQMSKQKLALVPGATSTVTAVVTPASSVVTWKSSNEQVATIAEDGTVTAVGAGTADITCTWKSETSDKTVEGKCTVTVADVDLSKMKVEKTYDFVAMDDTELTIQEEAAGAIWNAANSKNNNVFYCTNEGLEQIAVQAVVSGNKGWSIVGGKGLELASGAGRCAAVGGIKNGQIVEILYTGNNFYTSDSDDGVSKVALNEGVGRAIYLATEDGMLGFEIVKGNDVQKIIIYEADPTLGINGAKAVVEDGVVYNLKGQKLGTSLKSLKPGLYILNGKKVLVRD